MNSVIRNRCVGSPALRARRAVRLLALQAVMLLGLSVAAATPASAQSEIAVQRIQIEGAQRIEEATIRSYLNVNEGDSVGAAEINEALKRLVATGLFSDVELTPGSDGVLVVQVVENPIINFIAFEGNGSIEDEVLQAQIRTRPRTAFTRARAEADAQTIIAIYRAAGRYSTTVEPKIIQKPENRVDLVFEITEGDVVGIAAVNFVGNTEYSDRRLRGVIETEESAWWKLLSSSDSYDPDRLEFDKELLRRFYFARGFADFEVVSAVAELNPERDEFFITFTVNEGEEYTVGEVGLVSNTRGLEAEQFEDLLLTDSGDTYDADLVEKSIGRIQRVMGEEGINFVDVRPRANKRRDENDEPIIDLTYELNEGQRVYVERIDVEGNIRTLDRVIRREFELVEGDAFNAYRLQQSRTSVRRLGYFSAVDVSTVRGSADDRVIVKTVVEEQSTGEISFGLGFSSNNGPGGEVSVTERNFLGRGQFVRASVSLTAERQLADFRFTEPYFLDRNLAAGFDIFHREIDNSDESSYEVTETGFRPRVRFPISEESRIGFSYLIESSEVTDVPDDASPLIAADQGSRITSAIGYNFFYDQRNDRLEPTDGYELRLGQDFAGLGGDSVYISTTGSVKGYKSFFREDVVTSLQLAGGAIVSFADEDTRVTDRFQLGGDSFRGFANSGIGPRDTNNDVNIDGSLEDIDDALGGNYYAVARADVSFPIGLPEEYGVFGGFFADAGSVWGLDTDSYTDDAAQNFSVDSDFALRAAAGATVFWSSPVGPLRLNFAFPLIEEEEDETEFFQFSVGTRF